MTWSISSLSSVRTGMSRLTVTTFTMAMSGRFSGPLSGMMLDYPKLLENGVGGAIFLNGRQYDGVNGRSAEFGHICVESGGLACACGRHGCLEAYCSMLRISEKLSVTAATFFQVLREEPDGRDLPWERREEFRLLWEDYLHHLAIGVSNLRLTFDCDVVIGGTMLLYLQEDFGRLRDMAAALDPFTNRFVEEL